METTINKQESVKLMLEFMNELGVKATERDLIDFDLQGGENIEDLKEWVRDLAGEEYVNKCEARDAWRYEV